MRNPWQTIIISVADPYQVTVYSAAPTVHARWLIGSHVRGVPAKPQATIKVEHFLDWCPVGRLTAYVDAAGIAHIVRADVSRLHRRLRIGRALMYELEKRYPGVVVIKTNSVSEVSTAHWHANRDWIMADGPHFGRDDLYPYEPEVFE